MKPFDFRHAIGIITDLEAEIRFLEAQYVKLKQKLIKLEECQDV